MIVLNNAINISLSFKDVGLFVVWALLSGVLLYILLILLRAYKSIKELMKIVDEKRVEIDSVIDELPGITHSVNRISNEVAHGMEAFHKSVDNLAETSDNVTESLAQKSENSGKLSSLLHSIAMLKKLYESFTEEKNGDYEAEENVIVCKEVRKESEASASGSKKN